MFFLQAPREDEELPTYAVKAKALLLSNDQLLRIWSLISSHGLRIRDESSPWGIGWGTKNLNKANGIQLNSVRNSDVNVTGK
jgi:hypothetical protein